MSDLPPQIDPSPSPEETVIARADHGSVRAAIAALPEVFREAIVMRDINGLSYREIAQAAGVPIGFSGPTTNTGWTSGIGIE